MGLSDVATGLPSGTYSCKGQLPFTVQVISRLRWAQSAWKWAGPVAGVLLARNFKKTGHAFAKGSFLITAVQTGWKIWRSFRSNRAESDSGN